MQLKCKLRFRKSFDDLLAARRPFLLVINNDHLSSLLSRLILILRKHLRYSIFPHAQRLMWNLVYCSCHHQILHTPPKDLRIQQLKQLISQWTLEHKRTQNKHLFLIISKQLLICMGLSVKCSKLKGLVKMRLIRHRKMFKC